MIFQDPMTSLNPVLTIGRQIREALEAHFEHRGQGSASSARRISSTRWAFPTARQRLNDYPHQFSGGMRQRAMIAMALACEPKLLIADEPTTALDVTIQAQILDLLREIVSERDAALILITHDLGVVAGMCERVNVMYAGTFVETASASQLFDHPRHPYTFGLLQSIPRLDAKRANAAADQGRSAGHAQPAGGSARSLRAVRTRFEICLEHLPPLDPLEPGHQAACFNPVAEDAWQRARLEGAA